MTAGVSGSSQGWLSGHLFSFVPRRALMCLQGGVVLVAALAILPDGPAQAFPSSPHHTDVRLVADVRAIVPGGSFTLGLRMTMDPGWHTYWTNPGDAGLATQIRWTTPEGFVAGPILWPLPHKSIDSGDVLSYGYAGENMLLIPFTAPASLTPGSSATLIANVTWLECRNTCIPGDAVVRITLPVLETGAAPDNTPLFASYRERVPGQLAEQKDVSFAVIPKKDMLELTLSATGGSQFVTGGPGAPDFYPEGAGDLLLGRSAVFAGPNTIRVTLPLTAPEPLTQPVTVRGVVLYTFAGGAPRAGEVEIKLPPQTFTRGGSGTESVLDRKFDISRGSGGTQPLYLYVLFALLGGLLLNIMPCVLPVIALKVFGLVKMAGDQPRRIKRLGVSFAGGILASFLALASVVILLQLAGEQVGWGFQFQEPRFVIGMAAVVFAFGLSLFGVFEITLPPSAVMGISSAVASQKGSGYGASFGEGVFATVLATPCTAPFLGSALGFAFAQPWWIILLIFTCVAAGMALPYVVLTARPAWIRFLPKPGAWMVSAQQLMGFLMMATLLWLLYILGKQMGMEAVIWTGAFLLSVGVACWLIGKFATLTASRRSYWLTWTAALLVVAGGYLLFLVTELDISTAMSVESPGAPAPQSPDGIAWQQFSLAGLEEDLRGDRPVFLDFTAEWCLTCKVNEKTVIGTKEVTDRFRTLNILAVRADWTNRNPDITKLLSKFGRSGVPLYVIFPRGNPGSPIVLPEVITSGMVLEALEKAR